MTQLGRPVPQPGDRGGMVSHHSSRRHLNKPLRHPTFHQKQQQMLVLSPHQPQSKTKRSTGRVHNRMKILWSPFSRPNAILEYLTLCGNSLSATNTRLLPGNVNTTLYRMRRRKKKKGSKTSYELRRLQQTRYGDVNLRRRGSKPSWRGGARMPN